MSEPTIDDETKIRVWLATSAGHHGHPTASVISGKVHIHPTGDIGPYLSMTVDAWTRMRDVVNAAIGAEVSS